MIKIENVEVMGWEHAICGMRNPMNSWEKSDRGICKGGDDGIGCENCANYDSCEHTYDHSWQLGKADHDLMMRLAAGGPTHAKYRRMITVYVDITAPLYWRKEFDTYKVGTVANSCSTMHKIAEKEFMLEDFSHEHLIVAGLNSLKRTIKDLNACRDGYFDEHIKQNPEWRKEVWWQMIQLLPSSYNQKRTVMMNYEVLANIYKSRRNHKLDEWGEHKLELRDWPKTEEEFKGRTREPLCTPSLERKYFGFCDWIKTLPYCELITGEEA